MPLTDAQWVALNLPRNSRFKKNGVDLPVEAAIAAALEATQEGGANVKERAIGMLLRMLAADYPFESSKAGGFEYSRQQLTDLADYWEGKANGDADPGGITSVPAVFDSLETPER